MASVLTTIKKKTDVHLFIHNAITTPQKNTAWQVFNLLSTQM